MKAKRTPSRRYLRKAIKSSFLYGGSHLLDVLGTGATCPVCGTLKTDNENIGRDLRAIGQDLRKILSNDLCHAD